MGALASNAAQEMAAIARRARVASRSLARAAEADRVAALAAIAGQLRASEADILAANAEDLQAARGAGLAPAMIDRLTLTGPRIAAMAEAVEEIATMPALVGRIEHAAHRENGLEIARMRIPLGVVAMIFESRPNVTTDAAALCLKSGNAVILRGGKEAFCSSRALGRAVAAGLAAAGLPADAVQVVPVTDRAAIPALLACDEDIDVVIPRGGEGLIRFVTEHSRIPVLKHYKGVCHVFVDAAADLDMAMAIIENAKVSRPGVCNAAETVLIHRACAQALVPRLVTRLGALGVEVRGDDTVCRLAPAAVAATEDDWYAEYLSLILAIKVVDDFEGAIEHIEKYGSNHTEAIITGDKVTGTRFLREVGSSTVMVNASTRFADGGQLGLGAEIGISTTKLHAYGPMGAEGLTTTKFIVTGQGQIRT